MINVSFNTVHVPWPFLNQTQDSHGKWNDLRFSLNPEDQRLFEYFVVYDDLRYDVKTALPKSKRILFIAEPRSIASYPSKYLNQFGVVVCPYPLDNFKGMQVISQTALPWHFGVNRAKDNASLMSFENLSDLKVENKQRKISVVCSNKTMTAEHRLRLEFVQKAKEKLGDRLDIYGRGFKEIDDKAEVILPYQFHLVLENNFEDHFWTEKLADAYLGLAYPIFSGCRNINQYFDQNMITTIDIYNADESIQKLERLLDQEGFYQQQSGFIKQAKQKVMNEYNVFALIENIIKENPGEAKGNSKFYLVKPAKSYRKNTRKLIDELYSYKVRLTKLFQGRK